MTYARLDGSTMMPRSAAPSSGLWHVLQDQDARARWVDGTHQGAARHEHVQARIRRDHRQTLGGEQRIERDVGAPRLVDRQQCRDHVGRPVDVDPHEAIGRDAEVSQAACQPVGTRVQSSVGERLARAADGHAVRVDWPPCARTAHAWSGPGPARGCRSTASARLGARLRPAAADPRCVPTAAWSSAAGCGRSDRASDGSCLARTMPTRIESRPGPGRSTASGTPRSRTRRRLSVRGPTRPH